MNPPRFPEQHLSAAETDFDPSFEGDGAESSWGLRYEDVVQDGRLLLDVLPHAVGAVVWAPLINKSAVGRGIRATGAIPILTRLTLEGNATSLSVGRPLVGRGGFRLAHERGEDGAVERIFMNATVDVFGEPGSTYGGVSNASTAAVVVGRVFAEHTFTRLFAAPGDRKVRALAMEGVPEVPPRPHRSARVDEMLAFSADDEPMDNGIDEGHVAAPAPFVFGLMHTDSNQHVNSLVYPRMFEEAVNAHLARRGVTGRRLSRSIDITYRKPCFAGDRVRVFVRVARRGDAIVATGVVAPDVVAPDVVAPDVVTPDVVTPDVVTSEGATFDPKRIHAAIAMRLEA